MKNQDLNLRKYDVLFVAVLAFLVLNLTNLHSYFLFHSFAELFSVVVAWAIFMVAWNSRRYLDNDYILFIGISLLFVGGLDMIHLLSYQGMGVFHGTPPDAATQLWVAMRFIEGLSFLLAPVFFRKQLKLVPAILVYLAATALILFSVFYWQNFPRCFIEGQGLTRFKTISEYVISFLFLVSLLVTVRMRNKFEPGVFKLITLFLLITILAEISFSAYASIYGASNVIGHLLEVLSYYVLYQAIIVTGLMRPYDSMFAGQQRTEKELKSALSDAYKERQNWETIFEAAPFGIMLFGEKEELVQTNESLKQMFDLKGQSIIGQKFGDALGCLSGLDGSKGCGSGPECPHCPIRKGLEQSFSLDKSVNGVEVLRTFKTDGKNDSRWLSLNVRPIDIDGHKNSLVTIEDISQRKRNELMKNEFVSVVSHELRTPLTSIMGSLSLLNSGAMGKLEPQPAKLIDIAQRNSKRLVLLINDILDIEKINTGKMTYDFKPVDLVPLIEETVEANFGYAEKFNVIYKVVESLPEANVHADRDRIVQVIANLLSNAAKFSPPKDVVEVSVVRNDGHVRINVTDHGPGVPDKFREKIFEPFYQLEMAAGRRKEGSGLGLSICKAIIEQHGGSIGFEGGTAGHVTFFFELPEFRPESGKVLSTQEVMQT